jgi:signal peptidase I
MLQRKAETSSETHKTRRAVGYVVLLVVLFFLLYLFAWRGIRFFLIPSTSMEPTLLQYDYIVTLNYGRPARDPKRFDIIVFMDPEDPKQYSVKRVIGLPGDEIAILPGVVFLNRRILEEPYVKEPPVYKYEPEAIPKDHYFVLGDNRNFSSDSSLWHRSVPRSDIVGRAVFIYSPLSRFGKIRRTVE